MLRYFEKEMNSEETKIDVILKSILETLEKESGSDWKSVKISESHPIYL
jgi:hypothetical protein